MLAQESHRFAAVLLHLDRDDLRRSVGPSDSSAIREVHVEPIFAVALPRVHRQISHWSAPACVCPHLHGSSWPGTRQERLAVRLSLHHQGSLRSRPTDRRRAPTALPPGTFAPVTQGSPQGTAAAIRPGRRTLQHPQDRKAHEHETPHRDHETRAAQRSRDHSEGRARAAAPAGRRRAASLPPSPAAHRRPPGATTQRPRTKHRAMRYRGLPHSRSQTLCVTEKAGSRRRFPAGYLAAVAVAPWLGRSAPRL